MSSPPQGQRHPYKGTSPRAWVCLRLIALNGDTIEIELMVDTGCPFNLVISTANMARFGFGVPMYSQTNYGLLQGYWLHVNVPGCNFDDVIAGSESDVLVQQAKQACPDFDGIFGLPLLREFKFGGDSQEFWILPATGSP